MIAMCAISCRMGFIQRPTATPYNLNSLSSDLLVSNFYQVSYNFKRLWCAQMYLDSESETRDLMWFAKQGRCSKVDDIIIMYQADNRLGREVITNGLPFMEPGAEFKTKDCVFTCVEPGRWKAESHERQILISIAQEDALMMILDFGGTCDCFSENKRVSAHIEADYVHNWEFAEDFRSVYDLKVQGTAVLTYSRDGESVDWVRMQMTGENVKYTTSRD